MVGGCGEERSHDCDCADGVVLVPAPGYCAVGSGKRSSASETTAFDERRATDAVDTVARLENEW